MFFFKLSFFVVEKSQDYNSKQVHITNLNRIVGYCENITECRRALQLEYFGEHFTSEECLQNRETACDNCLRKKEIKVNNFFEIYKKHNTERILLSRR